MFKNFNKYKFFLDFIQKVANWINITMLIVLVLANTINLAGRTLFGFSLNDIIELSRFLLVYITMIGIYGAFRNKKFIRMDILEKKRGDKSMRYINIIIEFLIIIFFSIVIFNAFTLSMRQMDQYLPGLLVARGFIPFGVFIGASLLLLNSVDRLIGLILSRDTYI